MYFIRGKGRVSYDPTTRIGMNRFIRVAYWTCYTLGVAPPGARATEPMERLE